MHVPTDDCCQFHMPDPRRLGADFSWKSAAMTVFAAGLRPCSGAILVLVFALAQGLFLAGVGATFAMSLGTALTTASLAACAVLAKDVALRLTRPASRRAILVARGAEFLAACLVLFFGIALLMGIAAADI
jgi:nickel/cobalt exporter